MSTRKPKRKITVKVTRKRKTATSKTPKKSVKIKIKRKPKKAYKPRRINLVV